VEPQMKEQENQLFAPQLENEVVGPYIDVCLLLFIAVIMLAVDCRKEHGILKMNMVTTFFR
jgi:hypothetical protein